MYREFVKNIVFCCLIIPQLLMAQEFIVPKKQTQKGFVKLDFLSIAMPEHPILIEET